MPLYVFKCQCGNVIEKSIILSAIGDSVVICPICYSEMRKLFSPPNVVQRHNLDISTRN
jgi:putative FmdB family regulatory protein